MDKLFKPKKFNIQWHITRRCNLNCKHCYKDPFLEKKDLSYSKVKEIFYLYLRQLEKWEMTKGEIAFIGGEPLARKDFFKFLKEISKYSERINYSLSTNGTFLNSKNVNKLEAGGIKSVQISLEGREKINDFIRGRGVFRKILGAIKEVKKTEMGLSLATTVSKKNIDEVPHIINLAEELGITAIVFTRMVPLGNSKDSIDEILSPQQVRGFYQLLIKEEKERGIHLIGHCEEGLIAQEGHFHEGCPAGYVFAIIMPDGGVLPCRRLPIYAGNILKEGIDEIYYNSKIFKELRDNKITNTHCLNCSYFSACAGGAKCISHAYYGNFYNPDPQCWRIFNNLPKRDLKLEKVNADNKRGLKWITRLQ